MSKLVTVRVAVPVVSIGEGVYFAVVSMIVAVAKRLVDEDDMKTSVAIELLRGVADGGEWMVTV